jgi:hypothetical protein
MKACKAKIVLLTNIFFIFLKWAGDVSSITIDDVLHTSSVSSILGG